MDAPDVRNAGQPDEAGLEVAVEAAFEAGFPIVAAAATSAPAIAAAAPVQIA
jgi:hypothetical protein